MKCKTRGSPAPHTHPALQHEDEVEICADGFHLLPTPENRLEYVAAMTLEANLAELVGRAVAARLTWGEIIQVL